MNTSLLPPAEKKTLVLVKKQQRSIKISDSTVRIMSVINNITVYHSHPTSLDTTLVCSLVGTIQGGFLLLQYMVAVHQQHVNLNHFVW